MAMGGKTSAELGVKREGGKGGKGERGDGMGIGLGWGMGDGLGWLVVGFWGEEGGRGDGMDCLEDLEWVYMEYILGGVFGGFGVLGSRGFGGST